MFNYVVITELCGNKYVWYASAISKLDAVAGVLRNTPNHTIVKATCYGKLRTVHLSDGVYLKKSNVINFRSKKTGGAV